MGKKKPLTKYQQFLADHMPNDEKIYTWYDQKTGKQMFRLRTPTEWRRLLKGRMESERWFYDYKAQRHKGKPKYVFAVEAFEELKKAMNGEDYFEFSNAIRSVENAMKFQGYIQMRIAFIENLIEKSDDQELKDELRKKRLAMKLQAKVNTIGGA